MNPLFESLVAASLKNLQSLATGGKTRSNYFELTQPSVDTFVRTVFAQRFENLFATERERILAHPDAQLPYAHSNVVQQVDRLMSELKKQMMFDAAEVGRILHQSLLHRIRFLITPLQASEEMVFGSQASAAVPEIVMGLRQFEKYRYYPDALDKYAASKNIQYLSRGQYRLLMTEINQSLFGRDGLENVLKACGLIIKELNEFRGTDRDSAPIEAFILAFEDRQLTDFQLALSIEKELGHDEINEYSLRQVLQRFQILKSKKSSRSPESVLTPPSPSTVEILSKATKKEDSGEIIDIDEILASRARENTDSQKRAILERGVSDQTSGSLRLTEIKQADVTGQFLKEDLVDRFREDTSAIKLADLKESESLVLLDSLITDKDRKLFVKSMFTDKSEKLDQLIHDINRAKTWKEAIAVLDDCLAANGIDPYQKEAVRLSDLVYMRYYPPQTN